MKKYLTVLFLLILCVGIFPSQLFADTQSTSSASVSPPSGTWVPDPEVTFVGKMGARSASFLDWSLQDYKWATGSASLSTFWAKIRNIIYAFFAIFVLITAFILIVTQGKNITALQFIPRFLLVILLVTFSFALIQFLYQMTDIVQGFFLIKPDGTYISQKDLLYLNFDYTNFIGYRIAGFTYDESAFMSLLLIRLTAITYYAIGGILVLRKIILWFFIIVSPIFPLLLLYNTIRKTAKIWMGEIIRWVLYAPIFAILLSGLVSIWGSDQLPLKFDFTNVNNVSNSVYPTAINILLGGPGQTVSITNSVNLPDTFALYAVSLIMLWAVVFLPFALLQIFLDYVYTMSWDNNADFFRVVQERVPFLKFGASQGASEKSTNNNLSQSLVQSASTFITKRARPQVSYPTPIANTVNQTQHASFVDSKIDNRNEAISSTFHAGSVNSHTNIRSHTNAVSPIAVGGKVEPKFNTSNITDIGTNKHTPANNKPINHSLPQQMDTQQKHDDHNKTQIPAAGNQSGVSLSQSTIFSTQNTSEKNTVQDHDDSADMKQMWEQTYKNMEPPKKIGGESKDRKEWLHEDIDKLTDILDLLTTEDQQKKHNGLEKAKTIFPFLFMGNFSQEKVISYIKAKLDAAKNIFAELEQDKKDDTVSVDQNQDIKDTKSQEKDPMIS